MHPRTGGLATLALVTLSLGIAAPALAQGPSASLGPSVAPAASGLPAASFGPLQPGMAHIRTTGMVATDLVLPVQPEMVEVSDTEYDLRFQDAALDTLNITLTVSGGQVTDAFVGVGVPGTYLGESTYFADFFHADCVTAVTSLDISGVTGTISCTDLGNGVDDGAIDLQAEFDTGVIATATSPAPPASPAS